MASFRASDSSDDIWFSAMSTLRLPVMELSAGSDSASTSAMMPMTMSNSVTVNAVVSVRIRAGARAPSKE